MPAIAPACGAAGACRASDCHWPGNYAVLQKSPKCDPIACGAGRPLAAGRPQTGLHAGCSASRTGALPVALAMVGRRSGGMDAPIAWLLEVAVKPGQFDTFSAL